MEVRACVALCLFLAAASEQVSNVTKGGFCTVTFHCVNTALPLI